MPAYGTLVPCSGGLALNPARDAARRSSAPRVDEPADLEDALNLRLPLDQPELAAVCGAELMAGSPQCDVTLKGSDAGPQALVYLPLSFWLKVTVPEAAFALVKVPVTLEVVLVLVPKAV